MAAPVLEKKVMRASAPPMRKAAQMEMIRPLLPVWAKRELPWWEPTPQAMAEQTIPARLAMMAMVISPPTRLCSWEMPGMLLLGWTPGSVREHRRRQGGR